MRVFVSSTVYDLVDIRAELAETLRSLGISPVMSDDQLSDFHVKHSANSIDTCLANVDASDEVLVILDQRYGPRLGSSGFDDISATHLEYRQAINGKKPVHVYVRDRLEADYRHWRKNGKNPGLQLSWIQHPHDFGLLDIIEEHVPLISGSSKTNWYRCFTNSLDLKASIRKHFEKRVLPEQLVNAINRNAFPLLDIEQTLSDFVAAQPLAHAKIFLKNIGGGPAFNFRGAWRSVRGKEFERAVLPPGVSFQIHHLIDRTKIGKTNDYFEVEYESPLGIRVSDIFELTILVGPTGEAVVGTQLLERRFKYGATISIKIDE